MKARLAYEPVEVEDHGDDGMLVTIRGEDTLHLIARMLHYDDWGGLCDALEDRAGNLTIWRTWVHDAASAHALAEAVLGARIGMGRMAVALRNGPSSEKTCPECAGRGATREHGWSS